MISSISQISGASSAASSSLLPSSPTSTASKTSGLDFSQILSQISSGAVDTIQKGEAMSIAGIEGKAPVQQVVEAVMSAEQTLQTVIAIRDKAVAAFQQVAQMAI